jgi:hypothetical protein
VPNEPTAIEFTVAGESADIPSTFVMIDDRPITFWKELPKHRGGTATEIAAALRGLHTLSPPQFLSERRHCRWSGAIVPGGRAPHPIRGRRSIRRKSGGYGVDAG